MTHIGSSFLLAEMWKEQRKAFNPSFGPAILGSFVPIFNKKCVILIDILRQHVGKPERDFSRDIVKCTLDQIYGTTSETAHINPRLTVFVTF